MQQTTEHERKMARLNNSVVVIKNIDNEDFSHTFDGFAYSLKAGETLPFQYPVGMLMAKHLAMKIARKKAKEDKNFKSNTDRKSINLYSGKILEQYIEQIVVSTEEKPVPTPRSESEIMREKTLEMQKDFPKETSQTAVTKRDVIEELKKRSIKFDPRSSKEDLLELLVQAEKEGNTGEEE